MTTWPNQITGPNAGGPRPVAIQTRWAARVGQFCRLGIVRAMRTRSHFLFGALAFVFIATLTLHGAKPADFSTAQLAEIWTELWKSGDPKIREPKVEGLSEGDVIQRMAGNWTVMFGVIPDRLTISLSTNRVVEVSGRKDGKNWKKTGEWRVVSDTLVLFLQEDDIPSFIFRTRQHNCIFDPWAKAMMSELKREK